MLIFDGHNVLDRAVLRISRNLAWPELPPEARPPEQVERRLVLLHLGGCDECGEDDARLAAIDDVVVMIAQMRASAPLEHWRGIGVGGADAEVSGPLVGAARGVAVGATSVPDPVVTLHGALSQRCLRRLRQGSGKLCRFIDAVRSIWIGTSLSILPTVSIRSEEVGKVRLDGEAG